jgi:hypothetical protein
MKLGIETTRIDLQFNNKYWLFKSINKLENYLIKNECDIWVNMNILIIRKR